MTISTDDTLGCLEWRNSLGVHWPFLSDTERIIQKDLDIQEYTDPRHDPMIPHTFMLEPGLVIYSILGLVADQLVRTLERVLLRWRPSFEAA